VATLLQHAGTNYCVAFSALIQRTINNTNYVNWANTVKNSTASTALNEVVTKNTLYHLLPNPHALVDISKGMQAVKLRSNKILQFLTGGAS